MTVSKKPNAKVAASEKKKKMSRVDQYKATFRPLELVAPAAEIQQVTAYGKPMFAQVGSVAGI